jgi:magnesium-protoporphyrin O-methyltransferase
VVAIDLSPTLVQLAHERMPPELAGKLEFISGDMLAPSLGHFDHVVCMDSMIHYEKHDMVQVLNRLTDRTAHSVVFTFAPSNPILEAMIRIGRIFPRGDRAPFIEPVSENSLRRAIEQTDTLRDWKINRTQKISSGFYTSQAMEVCKT